MDWKTQRIKDNFLKLIYIFNEIIKIASCFVDIGMLF